MIPKRSPLVPNSGPSSHENEFFTPKGQPFQHGDKANLARLETGRLENTGDFETSPITNAPPEAWRQAACPQNVCFSGFCLVEWAAPKGFHNKALGCRFGLPRVQ